MIYERCYYCHRPASHTNSIPDMNTEGYNLNQCGYKTIYLCPAHAIEATRNSCSRVECIEEETLWDNPPWDWGPRRCPNPDCRLRFWALDSNNKCPDCKTPGVDEPYLADKRKAHDGEHTGPGIQYIPGEQREATGMERG